MKHGFRFVASLLAAAVVLVVASLIFLKRAPQPVMFCDQCVMQRDVVEWRLAGRKVFETSTVSATPVSELLNAHQACPKHEHQWSAPRYVAEADLETPDAPRVRSVGFLNAPRVVSFLRSLFDYTDARDIASWRSLAWKPTFASALEPALRFTRYPEDGFNTRAEFLAWWQQNAFPLFSHLNEMTVAD